jgi:hypothetical protein
MTQMTASPVTATPPEDTTSWNVTRIAIGATVAVGVIIIAIFLVGLGFALLTDATQTAGKIQIIRDIIVIIIAIEGILIVAGMAVLIAQIARLVNLLKAETKPILDNASAAAKSAKGTADFVGGNVAEPIIKAGGFLAGLSVFLREMGGIRRAIRHNHRGEVHGKEQ